MRLVPLLVLAALVVPELGVTQDVEFRIVVSPENDVESLSRREVARIFLKRTTRWPGGTAVTPVDQTSRSAVRASFTSAVLAVEGLGKMSAVENYWQQQIFSGRGTPPPVKADDAEVIAFVTANPGAIGYVSAQTDASSVKTVALLD